jgi:hypothetical protein
MYRFAQAFAVFGVSMWLYSWLSDFVKEKRRTTQRKNRLMAKKPSQSVTASDTAPVLVVNDAPRKP